MVGQLYQANAHLITFDPLVLPWRQFCSWMRPPQEDETEYYIGYDEDGFPLDNLGGLDVSGAVSERGLDYYRENRVRCLCLDGAQGRAIVEGTKPYEVESLRFSYSVGAGEIKVVLALGSKQEALCPIHEVRLV